MDEIQFVIDDRGAAQAFLKTERVVSDVLPLLRIAGDVLADRAEQRFAQGGAPQWQDIKPESRKRRKENKGAPPLTDTGQLRQAVTATRPGMPHGLYNLSAPNGLTMGTDAPGALALQEGNDRMPARPFLFVTDDDEAEIVSRQEAYIQNLIGV